MRRVFRFFGQVFISGLIVLVIVLLALLGLSRTDVIGEEWNPFTPLNVSAPLTPLTKLKLARATTSTETCIAALGTSNSNFSRLEDFDDPVRSGCGITGRIALSEVSGARISRVETSCPTALRLALWMEHSIKPLAKAELQTGVREVLHVGSYNCRTMRTSAGNSTHLSTHATASAIDVSGFVLENGETLRLISDWDDQKYGAFLKAAQDKSCNWFRGVLGPDYNALHADHFHMEQGRWPFCR